MSINSHGKRACLSLFAFCLVPLAFAGLVPCAFDEPVLSAQVPGAQSVRLAKASTLKCTFPVLSSGDWKKGESTAAVKSAKLSIGFTAINTQDGTAEAAGEYGKSHITVRLLGSYLHFMQLDAYGALYVTTVFDKETRDGKLQAAHSRHEYTPVSLPGLTSRPEQYYGECEVSSR